MKSGCLRISCVMRWAGLSSVTARGSAAALARHAASLPPMPPQSPDKREQARRRFGLTDACEMLCLFDTKSSAARKNPWGVIDAWQSAFAEPSAEARLTIKVSDLSRDRVSATKLAALIAQRDDMRLVSDHFSESDMTAFIGAFDVLVSLHRAEGFGLTLAEAMAQAWRSSPPNFPAICSSWMRPMPAWCRRPSCRSPTRRTLYGARPRPGAGLGRTTAVGGGDGLA